MPALPLAPKLKQPRFQGARIIMALILREMSATYGASAGGYIWALLQPVGFLIMLSFGFSLMVRTPSLGTSFFLFYASGYLPFNFYSEMATKIARSITYARALLSYPSVTWIDTVLSRFILHTVTMGLVSFLVISGCLLMISDRTIIELAPILIAMLLAALTGLGVGLVNATLEGLFPIWENLWKIVSRPLFLASGIFYIYEDLPSLAQDVLWWNPVLHITGLMRTGFYPNYHASYVSLTYTFGVAMILITLGLLFLRANHTKVLEK